LPWFFVFKNNFPVIPGGYPEIITRKNVEMMISRNVMHFEKCNYNIILKKS
jgi:hypothetical protein